MPPQSAWLTTAPLHHHHIDIDPGARIAPLSTATGAGDKMGSYDNLYEKDKIKKKPGDPNKRDFTYFVLGGARFIYASAARLVALKVSPVDDSVWRSS